MVSAAISGAKPKTMQDLSFALPTGSSSSDKVKFGEIMNMTLSGNAYNNNKASVESSANAQKSTDIRESGGKTEVLSNTAEMAESVEATETTENAEMAERLPEKLEVSEEEFQEDLVEAALDVVDAIEEEFNVSEEEILAAMQSLGMTVNDLLSPQGVTKLLESITQTDSLTFITDGDMMSKLNEVLMTVQAGIEGIAKANGLDVETADYMIADTDLTGKEEFVFETFRQHAAGEETPQNLNLHSDGKEKMMSAGESVAKDEVRPDVKEAPVSDEEPLKEAFAEKITVKTEETAKDSGNAETQNRDSNKNTFPGRHEGVEDIAQNLSQSVHKVFSEVIADKTAMIDEADIVRQVVDSVKLTAGRQMKTIEVMLNPDNLGKVHIAVTAREGAVTAQIIAQNEQVKAALENQMIALKEHFDNQGIKVDAVEVTVQSHAFEANQNFDGNSHNSQSEKKTHRPLNLSSLEELDEDEMSTDELRARDSLVNGESSVVYTA